MLEEKSREVSLPMIKTENQIGFDLIQDQNSLENQGIKIEEESSIHIARDEYQAESAYFVDSNLMSVKTEKLEELESFFVITEFEQRNGSSDPAEVTPLITDDKIKKEFLLDNAFVKVKNEIEEEFISEKCPLSFKTSSHCNDITLIGSENAMESEPCVDNTRNRLKAFLKNKAKLKIEPEQQIKPCSGNIQQERESEETSNEIKEPERISLSKEVNNFCLLYYITYVCPECGECLETEQAGLRHLSEQHGQQTNSKAFTKFKCKICGNLEDCKNKLLRHIRKVHNHNKLYSYRYAHILKKNTDKSQCIYCEEIFNSASALCKHLHDKVVTCKICGNEYKSMVGLNKHMSTHTAGSRFFCSVCKSNFRTIIGLNAHQALHSLVGTYQCEDCDHKFQSSRRLCQHRRNVHSDRFPCP